MDTFKGRLEPHVSESGREKSVSKEIWGHLRKRVVCAHHAVKEFGKLCLLTYESGEEKLPPSLWSNLSGQPHRASTSEVTAGSGGTPHPKAPTSHQLKNKLSL